MLKCHNRHKLSILKKCEQSKYFTREKTWTNGNQNINQNSEDSSLKIRRTWEIAKYGLFELFPLRRIKLLTLNILPDYFHLGISLWLRITNTDYLPFSPSPFLPFFISLFLSLSLILCSTLTLVTYSGTSGKLVLYMKYLRLCSNV